MLKQPGLFDPPEPSLLDLETTGTGPTRDRIIEVGLVLCNRGRQEQQRSSPVNPVRTLHLPPAEKILRGTLSLSFRSQDEKS